MKRVPLPFAPAVNRGSEHQARGAARNRCCWLNLGAAALILFAGSAFGLDKSTGPEGARVDIVKLARMYGLDGSGVRIGQTEPCEARATHAMFKRRVTRHFDEDVDDHATGVASIMIGAAWDPDGDGLHPTLRGVAHNARLWSSGDVIFRAFSWFDSKDVHIINRSAAGSGAGDGSSAVTLFADYFAHTRDVLYINSAGNHRGAETETIEAPGDIYNGISVGALGASRRGSNRPFLSEDYTKVANYSARGTTEEPDKGMRRHKPDIVAPGSLIMMAGGDSDTHLRDPQSNPPRSQYQTSGTSYSAPHVSGVAALLRQRAAAYDAPQGYDWRFDHRVLKATILNGASKHVRDPHKYNATHPQGIPWPLSAAANDSRIPADTAMGVGALNGLATIRQYNPDNAQLGVTSNTLEAHEAHYQELGRLVRGSLVTATLAWDRHVDFGSGKDPWDPDSYSVSDLADVDLRLVRLSDDLVVAKSDSLNDSIEHIYFNVPSDGDYRLEVGNNTGGTSLRFGLAYSSGSSSGAAFSVSDSGDRRAEGLLASSTHNGHGAPNDVNSLGAAGPSNFRIGSEIFVGSDQTNQQRLSGALGTRSRVGPHNAPPAALSLLSGAGHGVLGLGQPDTTEPTDAWDEITGLSWGMDGTRRETGGHPEDGIIYFSVDPDAAGLPNTAVRAQASTTAPVGNEPVTLLPRNPGGGDAGNEAAGDIFKTRMTSPFGWYSGDADHPATRANDLALDESVLGLQAPAGRGSLFQDGREDDLDAFEFDDPVLHERGVDPDGDGMHNRPVFFTLSKDSPTITGNDEFQAADIFVSLPRDPSDEFDLDPSGDGFNIQVYADHTKLGLQAGDVIDALIVSDFGPDNVPDGLFDLSSEVLFSLAPGSPSGGPGDVLYSKLDSSFSVFAAAADLGLREADNLNALDIKRLIPAPPTLAVFVSASLLMRPGRRA